MSTKNHIPGSAAGTNWNNTSNALLADSLFATFSKTQVTVTPLRLTNLSNRNYQALDELVGLAATVVLGGSGGPRGPARGLLDFSGTIYNAVDDAANVIDGDTATYYGHPSIQSGVIQEVSAVIDLGEAKTVGHIKYRVLAQMADVSFEPAFYKSSDGVSWTLVTLSGGFAPPINGPVDIVRGDDLNGGPHTARFWMIEWQDGGIGYDALARIKNFRLYEAGGSTEVVRTIAMKERIEVALTREGSTAFGSWKQIEVASGGGTYSLGSVSDLWDNAEILGQDLNLSTFGILVRRKALEDGNEVATDRLVDYASLSNSYNVWIYNNMATRPAERQLALLGKESTPGTPVSPTIRLKAARLPFQVQPDTEELRHQGDLLPADHITIAEMSEASLEGYPTYDEMGILLASVLGKPQTELVETGVYRHTFVLDTRGQSDPQTYTSEFGDTNHGERVAYCILDGIGFDWDRKATPKLNGHAFGKKMVDNLAGVTAGVNAVQTVEITGTPTGGTYKLRWNGQTTSALAYNANAAAIDAALEALSNIGAGDVSVSGTNPFTVTFTSTLAGKPQPIIELADNSLTGGSSPSVTIVITTLGGYTEHKCAPILPGHNTNYYASTIAGLGAGKIAKAVKFGVGVGSRYDVAWYLDASDPGFSEHGESPMTIMASMTVNADSAANAISADVNMVTPKYLRIEFVGGSIGATSAYKLTIDMSVKVKQPGLLQKEGVVYARSFEFGSVFNPAWGRAAQVVLINDVASY